VKADSSFLRIALVERECGPAVHQGVDLDSASSRSATQISQAIAYAASRWLRDGAPSRSRTVAACHRRLANRVGREIGDSRQLLAEPVEQRVARERAFERGWLSSVASVGLHRTQHRSTRKRRGSSTPTLPLNILRRKLIVSLRFDA
jgi:hypothetical protein